MKSGKYLVINLATNTIERFDVSQERQRKYLGGSGLAASLFLEMSNVTADVLGQENDLYIFNGPLGGTMLPGTSRFASAARSPLTQIWGESSCGGNFAPEMKRAGIEGLVIKGIAEKPVMIHIEDGTAEIRPADHLWGLDTYDTCNQIKEQASSKRKPKVLCIGPAGENKVLFAAVCNDKGNFFGRTGMGAIWGSKRLKAITCIGSSPPQYPDWDRLNALKKRLRAKIMECVLAQALRQMGTDSAMDLGMMTGDVPIRYWKEGIDLQLSAALGGPALTEKFLVKPHACTGCPIACKRIMEVKDSDFALPPGPGPEYETCVSFGTLLKNADPISLLYANELCNRLGMDTISCGSVIGFFITCIEQGIVSKDIAQEAGLRWGDMKPVIAILKKIAAKEGIGQLLAQGTSKLAEQLGTQAKQLAVHVKGLDVPYHDPRAYHGMGLAYIMSNRGACHLQHMNLYVEQGMAAYPETGLEEIYEPQSSEGKAKMTVISENLGLPCGSACLCIFVLGCLKATDFAEMIKAATGWRDYSLAELLDTGNRLWLLKRVINNRMGVSSKDDVLPKALLTPVTEGAAAGSVPDIELMKKEYYKLRGLEQSGIPSKQTLQKAGLGFLA